jgi:hypothetical protein
LTNAVSDVLHSCPDCLFRMAQSITIRALNLCPFAGAGNCHVFARRGLHRLHRRQHPVQKYWNKRPLIIIDVLSQRSADAAAAAIIGEQGRIDCGFANGLQIRSTHRRTNGTRGTLMRSLCAVSQVGRKDQWYKTKHRKRPRSRSPCRRGSRPAICDDAIHGYHKKVVAYSRIARLMRCTSNDRFSVRTRGRSTGCAACATIIRRRSVRMRQNHAISFVRPTQR